MEIKYPKPIMTATELREMGFTKGLLQKAFDFPGERIGWRLDPGNPRSKKYYDTAALERWRQEQMKIAKL